MDDKDHPDVDAVIDVSEALSHLQLRPIYADKPVYEQLSGGLTNDNVAVHLPTALPLSIVNGTGDVMQHVQTVDDKLVLRRFRHRTSLHLCYDRAQEYANTRLAASSGVGPAVIGRVAAEKGRHGGALALCFVKGVTLDDDGVASLCRSDARINALCDILHRLHGGPPFANLFDPVAARHAYEKEIYRLSGSTVSWPGYEELIVRLEPLTGRLTALDERQRPCHNDLLAANIIAQSDGNPSLRSDKLILVDYELSGMAPASWELGNIISENGLDDDEDAIERLVRSYWQYGKAEQEDRPSWLASRIARAQAWSIVSKVTWSAWGSVLHLVNRAESETSSDAFDYAAWSMVRVRRAGTLLNDTEAIERLIDALQQDALD